MPAPARPCRDCRPPARPLAAALQLAGLVVVTGLAVLAAAGWVPGLLDPAGAQSLAGGPGGASGSARPTAAGAPVVPPGVGAVPDVMAQVTQYVVAGAASLVAEVDHALCRRAGGPAPTSGATPTAALGQGTALAGGGAGAGAARCLTGAPTQVAVAVQRHYQLFAALAALLMVPLVLISVLETVARQRWAQLGRVAVAVPGGILAGAVALGITALAVTASDQLTASVTTGLGANLSGYLAEPVARMVSAAGAGSAGSISGFAIVVGALVVILGAVALWVELLVRASVIYIVVAFLPLGFAGLVWPATARWARRLVEILAALVFSQLVIGIILSLGSALLAAASPDWFGQVLAGGAILVLAAYSPFLLLRLAPLVDSVALGAGRAAPAAQPLLATPAQIVQSHVGAILGQAASGPAAPIQAASYSVSHTLSVRSSWTVAALGPEEGAAASTVPRYGLSPAVPRYGVVPASHPGAGGRGAVPTPPGQARSRVRTPGPAPAMAPAGGADGGTPAQPGPGVPGVLAGPGGPR